MKTKPTVQICFKINDGTYTTVINPYFRINCFEVERSDPVNPQLKETFNYVYIPFGTFCYTSNDLDSYGWVAILKESIEQYYILIY